ncbi:enoyl-CoA hydratase-related protein [Psychrobacter lutiphocae]|uniref:enoyl-CoA hydratase-related protein n=1 Tax=Psychrobacter lutiphocae TaxID=540500 RepID=UPI00036A3804|nr:enoyl-CoA hydratase-related protein [Psychrobacter lutiphocae]
MSYTSDTVQIVYQNGVATITLNRPKQLNAFNEEMHHALAAVIDEVAANDKARAIIITGAGKGFCAGQDLGNRDPRKQVYDLGQTITEFYNPLIKRIKNLGKPTVAVVNGVAAGAGIGIALACDIVLCSETTKFAMAFGKIGLVPDSGLTWQLVQLVGLARAKALVLTNATLSAEQALDYGLVWKVYESSRLMSEANKLATNLAYGPKLGMSLTIKALNQATTNSLEQQLELEATYQREAGYSDDYKEGVTAFLEKRPAVFFKESNGGKESQS